MKIRNKKTGEILEITPEQAKDFGLDLPIAKDGHWIQKAINPKHKGYCTPMTKSTCTPKRKALAKTLKKMAKSRKAEDGMEVQEQDQQMQQVMAMAMQAIQQGASPEQVMQMLVQQGVPQEVAQQVVAQVMQQTQPQEVPQAKLGTGIGEDEDFSYNSQENLEFKAQQDQQAQASQNLKARAFGMSKLPMSATRPLNQQPLQTQNPSLGYQQSVQSIQVDPTIRKTDFMDPVTGNVKDNLPYTPGSQPAETPKKQPTDIHNQLPWLMGTDYNMYNMYRNIQDSKESTDLLGKINSKDPSVGQYSPQDIKRVQRNRDLSNVLTAGYALAGARDAAMTGLNAFTTAKKERESRKEYMDNLQYGYRSGSVNQPYDPGYETRGGNLPYAEMGGEIPCADCGHKMAYGGKLGFIAKHGIELPTHARDLKSSDATVIAEGNGSKEGFETVGDPITNTVTNTEGEGTHEQQDRGKAKTLALKVGHGGTVLSQRLGVTLGQAKQLVGHIPGVIETLSQKYKSDSDVVPWSAIGDTQNTKEEAMFLKDNTKLQAKQLKIKDKNQGRVTQNTLTSIGKKTAELNTKFAEDSLESLKAEEQQIKDTMALKTHIHNNEIFPIFDHMKKDVQAYGPKIAKEAGMNSRNGKKVMLPKANNSVQVPYTEPMPDGYGDPKIMRELVEDYYKGIGAQVPYYSDEQWNKVKVPITDYQNHIITNHPDLLYGMIQTGDISLTNKAKDLYSKTTGDANITDEELKRFYSNPQYRDLAVKQFGDQLWGDRVLRMKDLAFEDKAAYDAYVKDKKSVGKGYYFDPTQAKPNQPTLYRPVYTGKADEAGKPVVQPAVTDAKFKGNLPKDSAVKKLYYDPVHPLATVGPVRQLLTPRDVTPFIEDTGAKDALAASTRRKLTEIQPQLNRLRRATKAQTRGVGVDPVSQAQMAQAYANEYEAANPVHGDKYNRDAAIEQDYINMQNQLRKEAGSSRAQALDLLAQREGTSRWKKTAMDINALGDLSSTFLKNRAENRASLLYQDMFPNTSYNGYTTQTLGGAYPIIGGASAATSKDQLSLQKLKLQNQLLMEQLGEDGVTPSKYGSKVKLPKKSLRKIKSVK